MPVRVTRNSVNWRELSSRSMLRRTWGELGLVVLIATAVVLVVTLDPHDVVVFWQSSRKRIREICREEVVYADVREWRSALVFLRAPNSYLGKTRVIEHSKRARPDATDFGNAKMAGRVQGNSSILIGPAYSAKPAASQEPAFRMNVGSAAETAAVATDQPKVANKLSVPITESRCVGDVHRARRLPETLCNV